MRLLKLSVALGAAALMASASLPANAEAPGTWVYQGWVQWHPHGGPTALSTVGKQVYFSKGGMADTDGDGVTDDKDQCPDTPKGVQVDAVGCPIDSDGDGVPDYLDKCPGTPMGTKVDATGCPVDSDNDGVLNDQDQCPTTPRTAPVDARGCWVLSDTLFDTGRSNIRREFHGALMDVVRILNENPGLNVEVQGHTDSRGSDASNQRLSERRANAVRGYLVKKGISAGRLTATGYGESRPAASNDTKEGMAQNRRVELDPTTR